MKSRYLTAALKLVLVGAMSLSLAACNKGNSFQRPANAVPGNNGAISANGSYVRGSAAQSFQCNVNAPATSTSSPYFQQGPCFDQNLYNQALANGTLPAGTNTNNTQTPNQSQPGQQQVGANGQPVNPSQAPGGNPPNVSIDITPEGKIVKRNFRLVWGIGQEAVTDNCHYLKLDMDDLHNDAKNPDLNTKNISRFLYPQFDRFEMFFDENGNLAIAAQSINGQALPIKTPNGIPYTLHDTDQTIEVGAFSIAGPASTLFIANEKAAGQQSGTNEVQVDKALYDIQGGTEPGGSASGGNQNSASPGFVLGPQATTNNPNGGYRSLPMNPINETPATTALSIPGFTGKISTWVVQPQHITEILVAEIPFQSKTFVAAKPDVCDGSGHGRYLEMHLQPTQ